jgi:hypothetical protein
MIKLLNLNLVDLYADCSYTFIAATYNKYAFMHCHGTYMRHI